MTDEQALDIVAEHASKEIYSMRPYQPGYGIYDMHKAGLAMPEWLKRHWRRFPHTFPHGLVQAIKAAAGNQRR